MAPKSQRSKNIQKSDEVVELPPPPEIPTDWLTVREIAEILRTSDETVRRAMAAGELPSAKLVGGRKCRRVWLAEYIEAVSTPPEVTFHTDPKGRTRILPRPEQVA
jgi:excisionase family DNA binding protein